jgi:hypothetical protein
MLFINNPRPTPPSPAPPLPLPRRHNVPAWVWVAVLIVALLAVVAAKLQRATAGPEGATEREVGP